MSNEHLSVTHYMVTDDGGMAQTICGMTVPMHEAQWLGMTDKGVHGGITCDACVSALLRNARSTLTEPATDDVIVLSGTFGIVSTEYRLSDLEADRLESWGRLLERYVYVTPSSVFRFFGGERIPFDSSEEATAFVQSSGETNQIRFAKFIDEAIKASPIEARIIKKLWNAFEKAGNPIVKVRYTDDGSSVKVGSLQDVYNEAFNLDEFLLETKSGQRVLIVMGNEWDAISDYNTSLEDTLKPIDDWINQHS